MSPSIFGSVQTWITTKIEFKQGQQELNGEEALAYVRMRKQDPNGDYGRAARQRQLLAAVAQKLNSTSTVFKIKDLTAVVGKYIKTDIPISDGLALYKKLSGFDPSTMQTFKLEGEDKNRWYLLLPSGSKRR